MASQLISLCLLILAATCAVAQYGHGYGGSSGGSSGGSGGSGGYGHGYHHTREEPYDPNPHYTFHYGVHDTHTHDIKSHKEERKGDVVHGSYDLIEPDGTKRVVEYTADHHTGFNAIVHREHNQHPTHYATPQHGHQSSYHSAPSHY